MAIQIQLRHDTAANWTSVNPILAIGEMGVETDTSQFKIGDGVSAWSVLAYGGLVGPAQTDSIQDFGSGDDGNVTISAGITTLTVDTYYNNLTLSGTGKIKTNGYRLFVKGTLDISAATVGAISLDGNDGTAAATQAGAAGGAAYTAATVGANGAGGAGATGLVGAGAIGAAGTATTPANGGSSGGGGAGGAGSGGAGGALRAGSAVANFQPFSRFTHDLIRGVALVQGGCGGAGGSSGGGDGVVLGRGGGGGGAGGGVLAIWAANILKSGSTPAGCISAHGGIGGNGAAGASGNVGGGGGAGGGGGGAVLVYYKTLSGPVVTNLIDASGGDGGNGGNGFGTGIGGNGGSGGNGGRIRTYATLTEVSMLTIGAAGGAGNPGVGLTGGTAGAGGLCKQSF